MKRNRHWYLVFLAFFGAGVLLPIIAAVQYSSGDDTPLTVDRMHVVAEGTRGSTMVLQIPFSNEGDRSVRILGASIVESCSPSGCVEEVPDLPKEIPALATRTIRMVYKIGWQDEPPYTLTFYTDIALQPQISLVIENRAIK